MSKPLLIILTTSDANASRLKNDLKRDFDLVITKSGQEALAAIQKKMPTAIVMDHSIEDFMTYRFIDKVRNNPVTRNLSFILVSRESSHTFVHEAVRSGVSHYIGIPYEKEIFLEKIKTALRPGEIPLQQPYFTLPTSMETQVISYGRISYVSAEGIHFETRLSLNAGDRVVFTSPLAEAIEELSLDATVTQRGSDVFYNYPFAIDANWTDPQVAKKVKTWISRNQNLNSPKKSKILFISNDTQMEREINDVLNKSHYSARFLNTIDEGLAAYPFLNPACVVVDGNALSKTENSLQQKFFKMLNAPWILFGEANGAIQLPEKKAFEAPADARSINLAIQQISPWKAPEKDRIYFSKNLEDSRLRIFMKGKIGALSELGVVLHLEHEVIPPCNFQLDLKMIPEQNMRNPYVRVWPPVRKLLGTETDHGKYKISLKSHFLGINDEQAGIIRKWLRDEELKDQRKLIADKPPAPLPKPKDED